MRNSLGGEVHALCEMAGRILLLKDFFGPFWGVSPGLVGLEDCESLFTHLTTKKMNAEKYLVRHSRIIQQASGGGDLEHAFWFPGTENPADGLTRERSDMAPFLSLLESGRLNPASLRPLKGAAWLGRRT